MATDRRAEQDGETLCRYACKLGLEVLNRALEEQAKAMAREPPEFFPDLSASAEVRKGYEPNERQSPAAGRLSLM